MYWCTFKYKKTFWIKALLFFHKLQLRSVTYLGVGCLSDQTVPISIESIVCCFRLHRSVGWETVTGADHKPQLPPDMPVQVKACSCCSAQRPLLYRFNWENWRRSKESREDLALEVTGKIRETSLSQRSLYCLYKHVQIVTAQYNNTWISDSGRMCG